MSGCEPQERRIMFIHHGHTYSRHPSRSNTKVKLFVDFAEATEPFRNVIADTPSPNAVDMLRKQPQDQGCDLGYAADMCLMLTEGLHKHPGVDARQGQVTSATLSPSSTWTVEISQSEGSTKAVSDRLVLCTGSSPTSVTLPVEFPHLQPLDLDAALRPSTLEHDIPSSTPTTVAVIGASHSAVLVLINLYNLARTTHPHLRIKWFTRHALRYAEFMDGWILRDNTGLKGAAAAWAKANLEPDKFATSDVGRFVTKIEYSRDDEVETYERELRDCQRVVQAVGYARDATAVVKNADGTEMKREYDPVGGGFVDDKGTKVPALYGAGIAYPNRVVDPYGNVEYAVGFWKFMKYIKGVVKDWN